MANPAWYNDNQFRDYPFLTRVEPLIDTPGFGLSSSALDELHLPHSAILDFGAVMEIDAGYDESLGHYVYLHSVSRAASLFTFKLRTNAEEAANHELIFHRNLDDPEFLIEWEEASTITPEVIDPLTCPARPKWHGFMATGSMRDLADLVASGETVIAVPGEWKIEPARIQSLLKSYLRAINLANHQRVLATPQDGCSLSLSDTDRPVKVNALCLDGNLQFKEGFNCYIRQDNNNNAIIIGAGVGVGAGLPCEEVPIYPGEEPVPGSPFLSGGPSCNDIIKSINGVSGSDVNLAAGPGFKFSVDELNPNKLIMSRLLDDFAVCQDENIDSSLSSADAGPPAACDVLTEVNTFRVNILTGMLTELSAICSYNAGMSIGGARIWTSPFAVKRDWVDGAYCSIRWRAKISCEEDGLRVSITGYPLVHNTPCRVCSALLAYPLAPPLNTTIVLSTTENGAGCECITGTLAEAVSLVQLPDPTP